MHLTPQEKDKLLIVTAALLAERRLNRGLKLNHPEAVAWLSFQVIEVRSSEIPPFSTLGISLTSLAIRLPSAS